MEKLENKNYHRHRLIIAFWLIAILLGIIQAWTGRHAMNPDGVSYLDIGDAYFRRDWSMAINSYWNPFYAWLLGLIMFLLKPSPYYEFTIVHIVNFVIYLFALVSFHFFLMGLINFHRNRSAKISKNGDLVLSEEVLLALGYTLFIWSSLRLISIETVTPDMCVSVFIYLISGILLRIRMGAISWFRFIILGICLGFSYLSKSVMGILSFIFLVSSAFLLGNFRKAILYTLTALVVFLLIVTPFIIVLSEKENRFTFGDAAKLVYLLYVNNIPYPHYLGDGALKHPVRLLSSVPKIYEFGTPIQGTYPLHYDPFYWYEGTKLKFDLGKQIQAIGRNIISIFFGFKSSGIIVIYGIFIFCFMGYRRRLFLKDLLEYWFLLIPTVSALAMYSLIHIESRYIGPFIVLLWMLFFSVLRFRKSQGKNRKMEYIILSMLVLIWSTVSYNIMQPVYSILSSLIQGKDSQPHVHWQVATAMRQMGFYPGDKICYVGYTFDTYWARLARLQIVAEMEENGNITPAEANRLVNPVVIDSLTKIGVKAIVCKITLKTPFSDTNWKRIGNTDYYIYILERRDKI